MERRGLLRFADRVAYELFRAFLLGLGRLYFGLSVTGRTPAAGGFILAANHASFLDAFLVGVGSGRRVRFLMTDAYVHLRGARWFFRWNRVLVVREDGSNRATFRAALATLRRGEPIGIFPEGGISPDGSLQPFQNGAVALALRAGVPIVPMAITGASRALPHKARLPKPRTIRVRIGRPIPPSELAPPRLVRGAALDAGAERLRQTIARMIG